MSKRDLWSRIHGYHFEHVVQPELRDKVSAMFHGDDAFTRAFASKLAMKLGWSRSFALRAIGEYKRFVYLGTVADMHVTPSRVIDQVWHQHILFSRAYREFCRDVLQRDFDHNPELVPMAELNDVFAEQYLETLDAYRTEFDAMPPVDIWSVPKFRTVERKRAPRKLERARVDRWGDDTPLHVCYLQQQSSLAGDSGSGGGSAVGGESFTFGGGGDFAGGGSSRDWSGSSNDDSAGFDSTGGDSGSSDSGSDGGSSCSSSCGGGGGE